MSLPNEFKFQDIKLRQFPGCGRGFFSISFEIRRRERNQGVTFLNLRQKERERMNKQHIRLDGEYDDARKAIEVMSNENFLTNLLKWSKLIVGNLRSKVRQKNMISLDSKDSRKIIGKEKIMKSERLQSVE